MSVRLGIGVLDLLPQTTGLAAQVPDAVIETIAVLTVVDLRSTTSSDFFLHEGVLQSPADALDLDDASWPIRIPGLTHGLPFRLAIQRAAAAAGQQEAAPTLWTLDIEVADVEVQIPFVRPAQKSGGDGVTPLTLTPIVPTTANPKPPTPYLVGRGVLRISGGGPGGTQVQLVDSPDPLDPAAPTGAVFHVTAQPPSFLFGQSAFGMTLDRFDIDLSSGFTPAAIEARGHDERWKGVAFRDVTFYFPPDTPLVHSLSIGARDVIAGSPGGLQGEVRIEFGQDFTDVANTRITVKMQEAGGPVTLPANGTTTATSLAFPVPAALNGQDRRVQAIFAVDPNTPLSTTQDIAVVGVWWMLPDGTEGVTTTTPWFDAPTARTMRYRLRVGPKASAINLASPPSQIPDDQSELAEVTVAFPRAAGSPSGVAPHVDATVAGGPAVLANVLHLRGPRARLAQVVLKTRDNSAVNWLIGTGGAPFTVRAAPTITLPLLPDGLTTADLLVGDKDGVRRIRIDITPQGPLAVGHQTGGDPAAPGVVTVVGTGVATPTAVTDTFLATPFRQSGERQPAGSAATLAAALVTVPQGADAEVAVAVPAGGADPLPAPPVAPTTPPRAVQILYGWDSADPVRVVYPYDGAPTPGAPLHEADALPMAQALGARSGPAGNAVPDQIDGWLQALGPPHGRLFHVVGRTDDLALGGTATENASYNDGLALRRANAAKAALVARGIAAADIVVRSEQKPVTAVPAGAPPRFTDVGRLALPAGHVKGTAPVWNDRWTADGTTSAAHQAAISDPARPPYRCAEIFAVDTTAPAPPAPGPVPPGGPGVSVRMLVPGPDGDPLGAVAVNSAGSPPTDYRVRLRAKWDSPTVVTLADAIPSEAEALVAWKSAQVELPLASSGQPPAIPPPAADTVWQVLLGWTYDARTGETEASGALSLPDGTLTWASDALAGALAFAPAITALADPAESGATAGAEFVGALELLALGAAIGELINPGAGPDSSVDIDRFAIAYKWNGASQVAATVDYTVDLRVNVSVSGAGDLIGRLRLRYKGVGLRFDGKPGGGLAGVALTYDGLSVEVVDPGTWSLGGPLGQLIRIAASRIGNGSQWMEFDLGFALDLGVVTLEGATIRLVLQPFSVEFRGLTASIDIPGTIRGKGSVAIGDAGSFRALLSLEVIPAKLSAYGALAIDQDFVAIEVGIQLPVGLPLGGTGFGIFGFVGRFVANGTRNLAALPATTTDPVQKQLDWYTLSPELKYTRKSGQFAFGVGAVVGTLPDGAFTFNAEGSLTVGFPDVSVVFGIDAHLISARKSPVAAQGTDTSGASFRILGMVLIEAESIMVAVRATYQIPKVLKLEVPISAYFPLAGGDAWYIRIGTDNDATRPGNPVTITLLPDLLNVKAWAFVMIEERGLHHLGGTLVPADLGVMPLDFDGFSVGMGAGFDLKYSAGPFSIEITAFLLVGVGTKPLLFAGAAGIKGELDLVVVSVGVDGVINFHISPTENYVYGHFCGHIDCFFFDISGCVDIHFGDTPGVGGPPAPESPLLGIDLCDHLAAIKGGAVRVGQPAGAPVWPDTVAVLRFAHYVEDGLGTASVFNRRVPPSAALSAWSGSTELKYAFRLKSLELWKQTGADPNAASSWTKVSGPIDSAWWLPTHRAAVIEGGDAPGPSTEEGRELGLFSWDPRAWSRWLGEGSQNVPGDPANTVGTVCQPARPADPACAYGQDWTFALQMLGAFKATPAPGAAFPSRFTIFAAVGAGLDAGTLAALGADAGWVWLPGAVANLHGPVTLHGQTMTQGWRFPEWRAAGRIVASAPMTLTPSTPLSEGEMLFEVCVDAGRAPLPSQCDLMPTKDGPLTQFVGTASGSTYSGRAMEAFALGDERALRLKEPLLLAAFKGISDGVNVDLDPGSGVAVLAVFGSGTTPLGQVSTQGKGRQWLRFAAAGITRIELRGSQTTPILFEVCWGARPAIVDMVSLAVQERPSVIATDIHGKTLVLTAEALPDPPSGPTIAVIRRCPKLRYVLPKSDGWTRVDIAPWVRGDLTLVAFCGITTEAAAAQAADGAFRSGLSGLLQGLAHDAHRAP